MKKIIPTFFLLVTLFTSVSGQSSVSTGKKLPELPSIGGRCDRCEGIFDLRGTASWTDTLPGYYEAGECMVISGTIFQPDGRTPAPGIILYVYHTDTKGLYAKRPGDGDDGPHGYMRGWMKTDAKGRYRFFTIRPASYPNSRNPQHIHPLIYEPGKGYYWIDEYLFADDPLLPAEERNKKSPRGSYGVITLTKNSQGLWEGKRDIVLGKNVAGYK